jgi:hypothetical protein
MPVSTSIYSSRDGNVPIESSIVSTITDVYRLRREGLLSVARGQVPVRVQKLSCQGKA